MMTLHVEVIVVTAESHKCLAVSLKTKVMLEVFSDTQIIIQHKYIPESATVKKERHKQVLTNVWEEICLKQLNMWVPMARRPCSVIQDSSNSRHMVLSEVLLHPLYSPNFTYAMRLLSLSTDEGPSLEGWSRRTSSFKECSAGSKAWWLPELF
jgi:hypothetical protein